MLYTIASIMLKATIRKMARWGHVYSDKSLKTWILAPGQNDTGPYRASVPCPRQGEKVS